MRGEKVKDSWRGDVQPQKRQAQGARRPSPRLAIRLARTHGHRSLLADALSQPLPVPRPHRCAAQVGDQRQGALECIHRVAHPGPYGPARAVVRQLGQLLGNGRCHFLQVVDLWRRGGMQQQACAAPTDRCQGLWVECIGVSCTYGNAPGSQLWDIAQVLAQN